MAEKFDPYYQWLGIPANEQPPHHYRLLGIALFEENPTVIGNAADRQMAHLRTFQGGKHVAESQRLLNEVAAARICLLTPVKKSMYDEVLRENLRASGGPADHSEPNSFDSGLAAILETRTASSSANISKGRAKKSQPKHTALIVAAALTVVAICFALWATIANDKTRQDGEIAKAGDPATSATPPKAAAPTPVQALKKETPTPAKTKSKEDSKPADLKPEIPKSAPEPVAESKPQPKEDAQKQPTPAPGEPPVAKPEAPEEKPPDQKVAPPSADEQKRLIREIDDVYKPGEAKDQAAKTALARRLLEDGQKDVRKAEQFVLLRRAAEIASQAGEVDLVLEAVDAIIAAGFDIRPYAAKAKLLKDLLAQSTLGASELSNVTASCVTFAEEAAANGAIGEATDVIDAAKKSLDKPALQAQNALRAAKAALPRARTPADRTEQEQKAGAALTELDAIKSARLALTDCANGLQQVRHEHELKIEERLGQTAEEPLPEPSGRSTGVRPPMAVAPFNEKAAKQHQARWAKYLRVRVVQTNSIGMKLVLIPPGEFMMGSSKELIEEELRLHDGVGWYPKHLPGEGLQHRVRITKPYWLGATDVTQEEYERVMGSNPSKFQGDPQRPVEQVSWDDAVEFCRKLSALPGEKAAKRRYGLPTEAQWEHACRAGTTTRWYAGDDEAGLGDVAWFNANSGGQTHPVGGKKPNAWGLYDMHGNVWEWCQDWYDKGYYAKSPIDDPAGPPSDSARVFRGGCWIDGAGFCRSAYRNGSRPGLRDCILGFRVCLVPADVRPPPAPSVTIIYAQWGGGKIWADVTPRVKELVAAGNNIWATVDWLKSDPTPRWKKHLKIVCVKDGQKKEIWKDEGGKVSLSDLR